MCFWQNYTNYFIKIQQWAVHTHIKKKKLAHKGLTVSFKNFIHAKHYHTLVLASVWHNIGTAVTKRYHLQQSSNCITACCTRQTGRVWKVDFEHLGGGKWNVMMMPSLVTCHDDAEWNPSSQTPSDPLLFGSGQLRQSNDTRQHHW